MRPGRLLPLLAGRGEDCADAWRCAGLACARLQALMLAGPEGLTTAEVARQAVELGWEAWEVDKARA